MRSYPRSFWPDLPLAERAKLLARQGNSVILADDVRVVKLLKDGETGDVLVDVERNGEEVGEVVMRGNTVMKEVSVSSLPSSFVLGVQYYESTSGTPKLHERLSKAGTSTPVTSQSCTPMRPSQSKTAVRISSFRVAR